MVVNGYIENIFNSIGIMINEETNMEILYYFPLVFDEKNSTYDFKNSYSIVTQPLGTFFTDFLNTDFEKLEEFNDLFIKYSFAILGNEYKKINKLGPFSKEDYQKLVGQLYSKKRSSLIRIQEQLDEILDYCIINPRNRKNKYSALDRFLVLQSVHENLTLFRNNKIEMITFYKIANQPLSNRSEDEIYNLLKDNKPTKYFVYIPTTIESLIYFVLCKVIENKLHLKICKNCNNYFLTTNSKISYCNNIALYSEKTCKEIGASSKFQNSINNDELLKKYYKLYSKKSMLARRNPNIQEYVKDFNNYKKIGKSKVEAYKTEKISSEEFEIWLSKKDK